MCRGDPRGHRVSRLVSDLELHRPLCLLLHDNRALGNMTALNHIVDAKCYEITPAQFAVDARLNNASSRVRRSSCSRIRMAQISFSFSGGFWPSSLPLFHGNTRPSTLVVCMNGSSVEGKEPHADRDRRALVDPTTNQPISTHC